MPFPTAMDRRMIRSSMAEPVSPPRKASSSTFFDSSEPSSSPPFVSIALQNGSMKRSNHARIGSKGPAKLCNRTFTLSILAILLIVLLATIWHELPIKHLSNSLTTRFHNHAHSHATLQPASQRNAQNKPSPQEWLRTHSTFNLNSGTPPPLSPTRPRAALISLVRNSELPGILQSISHLEATFNHHHHYPWLFFSESPFSPHFISATSNATSGPTSYHLIPPAHWSTPSFINLTHFHDSLSYLDQLGVGKGNLLSYRHMCRWNSGFFFLHPALAGFDYYWRVEPDVHFFCHLPYDPFQFMADNDLVYGFNMNILEDARSFPSLWPVTLDFIRAHPEFLHPNADYTWLLDEEDGGYNNCQFFSNFEIASLSFFRSEAYTAYFNHLDQSGGFFYERFGDAPVHTLAVSLLAGREQVWWFGGEVGYQHDGARVCPRARDCMCEPTPLDQNFYKLVPMESPQRKPRDTCLRRWLGGEWLRKREGWEREVEVRLGGNGFGGYVRE